MKNLSAAQACTPAFSLFTLLLLSPASAQQAPAATIDPKAQEVVRQSAAVYAALHSYSCQADTRMMMDSLPGDHQIVIKLKFQKPDHAAIYLAENNKTRWFLTSGKSLVTYTPGSRTYAMVAPTPDELPATTVLIEGASFIGLVLLTSSAILEIASAEDARSLTLGPLEMIGGTAVRTVTKVRAKNGATTTIALTLGVKDHLLYRYVYLGQSSQPLPMGDNKAKRVLSEETYTDVRANPVLSAASFLPSAGAKKIKDTETK